MAGNCCPPEMRKVPREKINVPLVQFNDLRGCCPGDVSAGWSDHRRYDRGDIVMSKVAVAFNITNCLTTRVRWLLVPKERRQMTSCHQVQTESSGCWSLTVC